MQSRQAPRPLLQRENAQSARAKVSATAIGLRPSADDRYASSRYWRVDENHPLHKIASQALGRAVCQWWFSPFPRRRKPSRSRCISLPPTPDFLYQESDNDKERIENPNAHGSRLICQRCERHVRITHLDDNEDDSESDHSSFSNCRHRISRQAKHDSGAKQPNFQRKLGIPIIPQTETHLPRVVVDREITRMRDQVENPVRENSGAHHKSSVFPAEEAASTAKYLVSETGNA